jgi:choline-sulfatase
VLGEYVGEGSIDPMLMVRQGPWKFNYCETDYPQLFNLESDPLELDNLANAPDHLDRLNEFKSFVHKRWNVKQFREDVLQSQKNRHTVYQGLRQGEFEAWDFQPIQDSKERYMRNHLDLNVLEGQARFPREKK